VISFIIPAHNEEVLIGRTLAAIHLAARAVDEPYEIIVANDTSADRTEAIALEHGARVVSIQRRQIAAARNAGAQAATGDVFIFVDADTVMPAQLLRAALHALRRGAVGGGCTMRIDGRLPLYARILERIVPLVQHAIGIAGGCFLFCTRQAYLAAGGFDETLFVTEEVSFGQRLKRQGRFVILRERALTSGRKLREHTALDLLRIARRFAVGGPDALRRRQGLEYWYGPRKVLE
jgi:glycosyltransferase involved in cell wall biosynthesis